MRGRTPKGDASVQDVTLQAKTRQPGKKSAASVRREGMVPGVMYGQGEEARPIAIEAKEVEEAFMTAGANRLISLTIDQDKAVNTLFVDVQHEPLSGSLQHFDLYTVKMDEEIEAEIPIHLENDAPATYEQDGILVQNLETVEVRSLPDKLPENFTVDLSGMAEINDAIHISDLNVPTGVTILAEEDELVVKIDPPRSDEELEELEEEIETDAEGQVTSEHGTEETEEAEDTGESAGDESDEE
jgi:large subunit ribosomal protein L25